MATFLRLEALLPPQSPRPCRPLPRQPIRLPVGEKAPRLDGISKLSHEQNERGEEHERKAIVAAHEQLSGKLQDNHCQRKKDGRHRGARGDQDQRSNTDTGKRAENAVDSAGELVRKTDGRQRHCGGGHCPVRIPNVQGEAQTAGHSDGGDITCCFCRRNLVFWSWLLQPLTRRYQLAAPKRIAQLAEAAARVIAITGDTAGTDAYAPRAKMPKNGPDGRKPVRSEYSEASPAKTHSTATSSPLGE